MLKPNTLVALRNKLSHVTPNLTADYNARLASLTSLPNNVEDIASFHDYRRNLSIDLAKLKITDNQDSRAIIAMNLLEEASDEKISQLIGNSLPEDVSAKWTSKKSGADFVVQVYLEMNSMDLIRRAIHQHGTIKPKGYTYYTAAFRPTIEKEPIMPDDEKLDWAEGVLSHDFDDILEERLCDISITELDGEWYFDVVHGGSGEQGELINAKSEREDYVMQRPEYDTIVFNPTTGDLMMHLQAERKSVISCYLYVLSLIIFGVEDYWSKTKKFDLALFAQPVEVIKNKILQLGSLKDKNRNLLRVGLVEVSMSCNFSPTAEVGRTSTNRIKLSDTYCLTTKLQADKSFIPPDYSVDSVTLLFEYSKTTPGKAANKRITLRDMHQTPRGDMPLIGFKEWLIENKISLTGETLVERRKRFRDNPKLLEAKPKKSAREKQRPKLFEHYMSSNKRIPESRD